MHGRYHRWILELASNPAIRPLPVCRIGRPIRALTTAKIAYQASQGRISCRDSRACDGAPFRMTSATARMMKNESPA